MLMWSDIAWITAGQICSRKDNGGLLESEHLPNQIQAIEILGC